MWPHIISFLKLFNFLQNDNYYYYIIIIYLFCTYYIIYYEMCFISSTGTGYASIICTHKFILQQSWYSMSYSS